MHTLAKGTRHNATIALRQIKEYFKTYGGVHEGVEWLLDEDLEDHKMSPDDALHDSTSTPAGDGMSRRENEWFVLEVPELEAWGGSIEREMARCQGILSIRHRDAHSLVITCLRSASKDSVLKACTDLLFDKRLLARPKPVSPDEMYKPKSTRSDLRVLDDSDNSPGSPPGGQQASPSKKQRTLPENSTQPSNTSAPSTPATPGSMSVKLDIGGGYKNQRRETCAATNAQVQLGSGLRSGLVRVACTEGEGQLPRYG